MGAEGAVGVGEGAVRVTDCALPLPRTVTRASAEGPRPQAGAAGPIPWPGAEGDGVGPGLPVPLFCG